MCSNPTRTLDSINLMRDYRASARRGSKGGDDGPIRLGQRLYELYE